MWPGELGCGQVKLLFVSGSASAASVSPPPSRNLWEEVSGPCPLVSLPDGKVPFLFQSLLSSGPKPAGSLLSQKERVPDTGRAVSPEHQLRAGEEQDSSRGNLPEGNCFLPGCPKKTEGPNDQMARQQDRLHPELSKVASLTPFRWQGAP